MSDIDKEVSSTVANRLSSPFMASLMLSWCAINWKFFALLFLGDIPIKTRIDDAESVLNINSFYIAISIAGFYSFVWPWVNYLIEAYQARIKLIRRKESSNEEHELELQKTRQNLDRIRYETREQQSVAMLLKTQGQFAQMHNQQKEFIKEADALLAEAEERFKKIQHYRMVCSLFDAEYHEVVSSESITDYFDMMNEMNNKEEK